ncbi:MAG: 4'-phosphopantetheinyl transferase superfamily protein [Chitinophagaceae bacterium]|nr:4'-phosphopantetheinyl transferase superfamily protein [Chitinophagaceae bacterium]
MSIVSLYVFPINIDLKFIDIIGIDLPIHILEKALRFRKIVDQNNYLAARWILYTLAQQIGINHSFGDFSIEKNKKPYISGFPSFNISHCNGLVVVAVSDNTIGVDVENINRLFQLENFTQIFSSQEISDIEAYGAKAFFHYWTIKEAVLKCTGEGLAKLSTLQQINQKGANIVTHNYQDFNFESFIYNDSYMISCVRPKNDETQPPIKKFICKFKSTNTLDIQESEDLFFKFRL